ncbi:MAG: hypothetical protein HC918_11815 [Oscillatoriales cyanobacterium SM2_1_8]|nr:hypothetical protein [Oscillatoriales cyanobacterium SM2_1_8]
MANYEHLRRLRQSLGRGVDGWNRWRQQHPDAAIDLSGVDLVRLLRNDFDVREFDWAAADIAPGDFADRFAFEEFDLEESADSAPTDFPNPR